jgi:hypothetical protein
VLFFAGDKSRSLAINLEPQTVIPAKAGIHLSASELLKGVGVDGPRRHR